MQVMGWSCDISGALVRLYLRGAVVGLYKRCSDKTIPRRCNGQIIQGVQWTDHQHSAVIRPCIRGAVDSGAMFRLRRRCSDLTIQV